VMAEYGSTLLVIIKAFLNINSKIDENLN